MSGGYKVLLLGSIGVGKTSLMRMASLGIYQDVYKATIVCDFVKKSVTLDDVEEPVRLLIWDTAGTERYANISSTFYRGADIIIFVFDVTNRESFESVQYWESKFREIERTANIPYLLAANKCESGVSKAVSDEECLELCKTLNIEPDNYFEVSAKEALNVERMFERAAELLYKTKPQERKRSDTIRIQKPETEPTIPTPEKSKKKCGCSSG